MDDTLQLEDHLHSFRQRFESTRVELGITASPDSVKDVLSVVPITGMSSTCKSSALLIS
jgi:hypothetical protein